jgi:hypothetical protein
VSAVSAAEAASLIDKETSACRMSIDECRIKEFFLFYLLKRAKRSDIHHSSIVNHHSSFHEVSYKVSDK